MAHVTISITIPADLLRGVHATAIREGLPAEAWAALVIESERAVSVIEASPATCDVRQDLDDAAQVPAPPVFGGASRLAAYARAIRLAADEHRSPPKCGEPRTPGETRPVELHVPYHSASAWRLAAATSGDSLSAWASDRLASLPRQRVLWEAAAAEVGQTLGEWVVVQAARRSS